jgi:hydrogenase maturation protease
MTDGAPTRGRPVIVGFGNRWRGDDSAGPLVAERLAGRGFDTVEVEADGTLLLEAWAGRDWAIVVDAMVAGGAPGTVRRFEAGAASPDALGPGALPKGAFRSSTHLVGLAEAVELARALGRLPQRLTVIGIEASDFAHGAPPTPDAEAAIAEAVREVAALADRPETDPAET